MHDVLIGVTFLAMLLLPCWVALRSGKTEDPLQ